MKCALAMIADETIDTGIALHLVSGLDLAPLIWPQGLLFENLAGEADRGAEFGPVIGMRHVVESDGRRLFRIGGFRPDETSRLRAHRADMDLEGMTGGDGLAVIANGDRQEVIFNI